MGAGGQPLAGRGLLNELSHYRHAKQVHTDLLASVCSCVLHMADWCSRLHATPIAWRRVAGTSESRAAPPGAGLLSWRWVTWVPHSRGRTIWKLQRRQGVEAHVVSVEWWWRWAWR
eukprot:XP_001691453.1 predicted protein [Chlamydomonas reinhardtii]